MKQAAARPTNLALPLPKAGDQADQRLQGVDEEGLWSREAARCENDRQLTSIGHSRGISRERCLSEKIADIYLNGQQGEKNMGFRLLWCTKWDQPQENSVY